MSTQALAAAAERLMLCEQREIARKRAREASLLLAALIALAALSHGAAIYGGMRLERWYEARVAERTQKKPAEDAKPAAQTLGCRDVMRICRDQLKQPKG